MIKTVPLGTSLLFRMFSVMSKRIIRFCWGTFDKSFENAASNDDSFSNDFAYSSKKDEIIYFRRTNTNKRLTGLSSPRTNLRIIF